MTVGLRPNGKTSTNNDLDEVAPCPTGHPEVASQPAVRAVVPRTQGTRAFGFGRDRRARARPRAVMDHESPDRDRVLREGVVRGRVWRVMGRPVRRAGGVENTEGSTEGNTEGNTEG